MVRRTQPHSIDAKRIDVEMYREYLKARGIAATTRAFKLSIIRRFYAAAVRHELISKKPGGRRARRARTYGARRFDEGAGN
jgi:site-specific recombinase XerD